MKPASWLLRGLIIAGVIVLFFPAIDIPFTGKNPSILVLIDNSASMAEEGKQQMWRQIAEELNRLSGKYSLSTYSFSDSTRTVKNIRAIDFDGKTTDIYHALDEAGKRDADAILMVTDGRHNQSGTLPPRIDVTLWPMILGSEDMIDIGIEDAVAVDSNKIKVTLRTIGYEHVSTTLRVYAGDRELYSQPVNLSPDRLTETLLPLPGTVKDRSVKLVADSLPREDRTDNNEYVFQPSTTSRTLDVMFVSSLINQDTEALLEALRAIPDVTLHTYVEISPAKTLGKRIQAPDIVIVGPMHQEPTSSIVGLIESLSGSTPIMFISSSATLPNEIKQLSPLQPKASANKRQGFSITAIGDILLSKTPLSSLENLEYFQTFEITNGATEMVGIDNSSIIAVRKGQQVSMAVELPTQWITAPSNRESLVNMFRACLFYLNDPRGFPFTFTVNKSTTTGLDLGLFSQVEIDGQIPVAWLIPDSIPLRVTPLTAKSFKLTGTPPAGQYEVKISWKDERFTPGKVFEIYPAPPEHESKGANPAFMSQLADQTKGEIINVDQIEQYFQSLPQKKVSFKPLQTPFIVIIIGLLFLVEIWYRRRIGMP